MQLPGGDDTGRDGGDVEVWPRAVALELGQESEVDSLAAGQ